MEFNSRTAVVTGANRGIGLEIVKQLAAKGCRVILTARNEKAGNDQTGILRMQGFDVHFCRLDVSSVSDIDRVGSDLVRQFERIDILINNAAIFIDDQKSALSVSADEIRQTLETNLIGPFALCQTFIPSMKKQNFGRIINISSVMGALKRMEGGSPSYRISKTALNAMTRIMAAEVRGSNILINSMCPGWVRTEMGGTAAPRTLSQGADTAVWLAGLPDDGPSGKFFRDRHEMDW